MKDTFAPPFSIERSSPIGRQSAADAFMLGDRHSPFVATARAGTGTARYCRCLLSRGALTDRTGSSFTALTIKAGARPRAHALKPRAIRREDAVRSTRAAVRVCELYPWASQRASRGVSGKRGHCRFGTQPASRPRAL